MENGGNGRYHNQKHPQEGFGMLEAYERLCDVRSPQAANFFLYWRGPVELQPPEFFDCLLCCISLGNQFIQCLAFLGDDIRWCSAYKRFVR